MWNVLIYNVFVGEKKQNRFRNTTDDDKKKKKKDPRNSINTV